MYENHVGVEIGHPRWDPSLPGAPRVGPEGGRYRIYVLVDPRDETVRYVGMTKNVKARLSYHRNPDQASNKLVGCWIRDLRNALRAPRLMVVDRVDEAYWKRAERAWIAYYRALGRIYNVLPGGESSSNGRRKHAEKRAFEKPTKIRKKKGKGKRKKKRQAPTPRLCRDASMEKLRERVALLRRESANAGRKKKKKSKR